MFLEEKLDLLKKTLSPEHLVIRYTDYKAVINKIEARFLRKDKQYPFCGWQERFVASEVYTIEGDVFEHLKTVLLEGQKYWWVYVEDNLPSTRHRLFDATCLGGERLSYLFYNSPIFIIHKKYEWMLMIDRKTKSAGITNLKS